MGRGEVMRLEKKDKERRSRNAQVTGNGKSITEMLPPNMSLEHVLWCHLWL